MTKKFFGLLIIAIAALSAVACDNYTCAAPIDCALVGEWESVDSTKDTVKIEADGTYTETKDTDKESYDAKIVEAGYVTLFDKDGKVKKYIRYFFSDNKLYLNGAAYERKS